MIKVSVIVPVYNVEQYLPKCLDSLINQTFDDYEIIVVNDGSPDESEKIINEYEKNHRKLIKSYKKKNGGLSDARNFGVSKASGKYVMFVDSDDYVSRDMIEKLYTSIQKEKSDIAICNIVRVNHNNVQTINYNYNPGTTTLAENKRILFNQPSACNKMFDINLFEKYKFETGKYYEDFRLINKLFLKCNKISFIDDACYYYVERENSIMKDTNIKKNYDIIDAIQSLIEFYKKEQKYENYREEIEFLMIDNIIISTITRIVCASNFNKKDLNGFWEYIEITFPNFKKNKYKRLLSFKRRGIMFLNSHNLYSVTKQIMKIDSLLA